MTPSLLLLLTFFAQEWAYSAEKGYHDTDTGEVKSPTDLFALGVAQAQEGRCEDAIAIFDLLIEHGPTEEFRERALFERASAYWWDGRYREAHDTFALFASRYPEAQRARDARERAMRCALRLAEVGDVIHLLGIPVDLTSSTGVKLLRDFLNRYPREEMSAQYSYLLAEFLRDDDQKPEAQKEYLRIIDRYAGSVYAGRSLIRMAELTEEGFRGVLYNLAPLRDARRHLERHLEEYGTADPDLSARVRSEVDRIANLQAEADFEIARYYLRRGYPKSAALYFRMIQKDHPGTLWAQRSVEELALLGPEVTSELPPATPQEKPR